MAALQSKPNRHHSNHPPLLIRPLSLPQMPPPTLQLPQLWPCQTAAPPPLPPPGRGVAPPTLSVLQSKRQQESRQQLNGSHLLPEQPRLPQLLLRNHLLLSRALTPQVLVTLVRRHLDKTVTRLPKAARQDRRPVGLGPMEAGPGSRRPPPVSSNLLQQQCLLRYVSHCVCTGYTASACLLQYLSPRRCACDAASKFWNQPLRCTHIRHKHSMAASSAQSCICITAVSAHSMQTGTELLWCTYCVCNFSSDSPAAGVVHLETRSASSVIKQKPFGYALQEQPGEEAKKGARKRTSSSTTSGTAAKKPRTSTKV